MNVCALFFKMSDSEDALIQSLVKAVEVTSSFFSASSSWVYTMQLSPSLSCMTSRLLLWDKL